jgi:hypothetical protein
MLVRLSPGQTFVLTGLFLFGIPQLLLLATIAVVGRPALPYSTTDLVARLRLILPSSTVSQARYRLGLLLFTVAVLASWIEPAISKRFPALMAHSVTIGILFDAILLVALFVLGAGFWDKLHALFVDDARVSGQLAGNTAQPSPGEAVRAGWLFYLGAGDAWVRVWGLDHGPPGISCWMEHSTAAESLCRYFCGEQDRFTGCGCGHGQGRV